MTVLPENKLPLQHPDYRYTDSWNPYSKRLLQEMEGRVFVDNLAEGHRGAWRERLPDGQTSSSRKLAVEIGCNGGHVILEWATKDPATAYIGIDYKFKQIFRGAEKAQGRGLGNLLFLRAHAARLKYIFAPGEVDFLAIYFPDPWAKKSQLKNRLIQADSLREFCSVLKPGGELHIKTDHRGYFDWIMEAVEKTGDLWKVQDATYDLHGSNPRAIELKIPEVTLFEKLFVKDGLPVHSVRLFRK